VHAAQLAHHLLEEAAALARPRALEPQQVDVTVRFLVLLLRLLCLGLLPRRGERRGQGEEAAAAAAGAPEAEEPAGGREEAAELAGQAQLVLGGGPG